LGGRYGSTTADGISYTEKEYDYAVSRGLKVIAMVHQNPDEIPLGKSEKDPAARERLKHFRERVSTDRLVKFWKSAEDLPGLVALSLAYTIKTSPAVGWVRADKTASEDLLAEVNDLRKDNARLQALVSELKPQPAVDNLAGLDEKFPLVGLYRSRYDGQRKLWMTEFTWGELFACVAPYLISHPSDETVKSILRDAAFARSGERGSGDSPDINDQGFQTVALQLEALGLVTRHHGENTLGGKSVFWSLTPPGQRLMIDLRTVKKPPVVPAPG
jgi:hypothetical protein